MKNYTCDIPTPLGDAHILSDGKAVNALLFTTCFPDAENKPDLPVFDLLRKWLSAYFAGKAPEIDFPVFAEDTPFRNRIWKMLWDIPYGKTVTYGELAHLYCRKYGVEKMSAQAVGGAVGANPCCILIPCHRVMGANGAMTGYGEGIERKEFLLRLEGSYPKEK